MTIKGKTLASIKEEMDNDDPELVIGDYWIATDEDGTVLRKVRIVGWYPFENIHHYVLIEEQPSKMKTGRTWEISRCPEFNLRYVFRPEFT